VIKVENLSKSYYTEALETRALQDVTFSVADGEFVSIMGHSGCGKSTLLNILGLLDSPTEGSYIFGNDELASLRERDRVTFRKENIGFIFQSFNLIDELTVIENVELPLLYQSTSRTERRGRALRAVQRMGLEARSNHYPRQLSGGQQQRVAVARALAVNPRLILADEPTGNLDTANGTDVMNLLKELNDEGATVIMVTHADTCAEYSSRIIQLLDGRIKSDEMRV